MKKALVMALLFLMPSITYASWWSPKSWFETPQTIVASSTQACSQKTVVQTKVVSDPNDKATITYLQAQIKNLKEQVSQRHSTVPTPVNVSSTQPPAQSSQIASQVVLPVIQSTSHGVITGQGFDNITSVYLMPRGQNASNLKTDFKFGISNDSTITVVSPSFSLSGGWYDLYVSDSVGNTSLPYPILQDGACEKAKNDIVVLENRKSTLLNQVVQDRNTLNEISQISISEEGDSQIENLSCPNNLI